MLFAQIITSFPLQLVSDAWGKKLQKIPHLQVGESITSLPARSLWFIYVVCLLCFVSLGGFFLISPSLCLLFRFRHQIKSTVLTIWSTILIAHKCERSFTNVHMCQGTKPKENLVSICETTKQQYCVTPWERKQTENNSNAKTFLCKAAVGNQAS